MWVDGPDGTPYRPWGGVWISLETGVVNVKLAEADRGDATLALDALLELGFKFARTRPAAIQVADQALGEQIARAIGDPELAVTVDPHLAAVKAMMQRMAPETSGAPPPTALDRKGMTVERMRAFAAAARAFHDAAPWRFLSDEDLIHVEAPSVGAAFRHVTVLGAAGQTFGLGFFASPRDLDKLRASPDPATLLEDGGRWTVFFGQPWETLAVRLGPLGLSPRGRLPGLTPAAACGVSLEPASARLSRGRERVDGCHTSVVCHGQQGGGGDLRRRAGGCLEGDARCARVARGPRARREAPEASPALIQLRRNLRDSERPDLGRERIGVAPGMDHVDRLEAEIPEGDVHGLRDGGRVGPLELEPSALPRPHYEQIQLGALVGRPEIALLGPGVERPHYLLQSESMKS
jgi:hypothetical protein